MFKQLVLVLLVAVTLSQICPAKVIQQCQADIQKGTPSPTQPSISARKPPRKREPINKPTSTASNTSSPPGKTAGPASAKLPRRKDGRSRDATSWWNFWAASTKSTLTAASTSEHDSFINTIIILSTMYERDDKERRALSQSYEGDRDIELKKTTSQSAEKIG